MDEKLNQFQKPVDTKTNKVRAALESGDCKTALRISKSFRIGYSKEDRSILARGYECIIHPNFYKQLGIDPVSAISIAKQLLNNKIKVGV